MTTPASPQAPRRFRVGENRLLIAAAAVVVLTGLAIAGVAPRSLAWPLVLGYSAISTVALVVMVRVRERLRGFVGALAEAQVRVIDPAFALVPPSVAELNEELVRLGFRVVGVTDTVVGGRPDFRSWILVEPSGETWIETGDAGRAIAVLLSSTAGGRQVEAAWPAGMQIDEPPLLAAPASATLEMTLADHRARLAAERRAEAQLGVPPLDASRPDGWQVATFDDYLAWEPFQRQRTGGLRLKTDLRRRIEPAIRLWGLSTAVGIVCGAILAAKG
jgi:hypothetical protein